MSCKKKRVWQKNKNKNQASKTKKNTRSNSFFFKVMISNFFRTYSSRSRAEEKMKNSLIGRINCFLDAELPEFECVYFFETEKRGCFCLEVCDKNQAVKFPYCFFVFFVAETRFFFSNFANHPSKHDYEQNE